LNLTVVGASDFFARGFATWAVGSGHRVSIVGPSLDQAQVFAKGIKAAQAAGPRDPLLDNVIVFAMPYDCVLDARDSYGNQLDGKIVVDVTTPVDFDTSEPLHPEAGSVAEEIANARPGARVVKAFSRRFSAGMPTGRRTEPLSLEVLIASDDVEAKRTASDLFKEGGLRPIDVGPLRRARELEAVGFLQLATQPSLETVLIVGNHSPASPRVSRNRPLARNLT